MGESAAQLMCFIEHKLFLVCPKEEDDVETINERRLVELLSQYFMKMPQHPRMTKCPRGRFPHTSLLRSLARSVDHRHTRSLGYKDVYCTVWS